MFGRKTHRSKKPARFWLLFKTLSLWFVFVVSAQDGRAASCCGKGAAAPSLLTGETSMQVFTQLQHQGAGLQQIFGGSYQLADLVQGGFQVPLQWNGPSSFSALRTQLGFEWLPEWVIPGLQAFLVAGISMPLVRPSSCCSIHTRRGYWTPSLAAIFLQRNAVWDLFHLWEAHVSLIERFEKPKSIEALAPGWGGSVLVAGGYSFEKMPLRLGLRFSPQVDQGGARMDWITGKILGPKKGIRWILDAGFDCSWMFSNVWSVLLGLTQPLFVSDASQFLRPAVSLQLQWRTLR